MGCRNSHSYTEKQIQTYLKKNELSFPSAELIDENIRLKSIDGFYNSSSLLDSTCYSNDLPINQIPKSQLTKLAIEELNHKYTGYIHFIYQFNHQENSINSTESFIFINFN